MCVHVCVNVQQKGAIGKSWGVLEDLRETHRMSNTRTNKEEGREHRKVTLLHTKAAEKRMSVTHKVFLEKKFR